MTQFPLSFSAALKIYQLSKPNLSLEYDYIMVDEAQDTDLVALDIINSQNLTNLQVIVIGDSYQQIYSWRGAIDALNNVKIEKKKYLSKSFRFGKRIADLASSILANSFHDFDRFIVGNECVRSEVLEVDDCIYRKYDAIITRTNAGLLDAFIKASEQDPTLKIEAKIDFKELEDYISEYKKLLFGKKVKVDSVLSLFENMEQLLEYVDQNPTDSDISTPCRLIQKIGLNELVNKLGVVKKQIGVFGGSNDADLKIITAHKSKGLEFNHVVIYEDFNPFVIQKKFLNNGSQVIGFNPGSEEEARLFYVAVTRGIREVALENFLIPFVDDLIYFHNKNRKFNHLNF